MGAYLAGIGIAVAASAAGYQSMAPTGQWYGRNFHRLSRGSKKVALTYDDGPNDPYTLQLLEVLARHNVKATFFMIGEFVCQRPEIARAVLEAGHAVGNHTFSHPLLIFKSASTIRRQLADCQGAMQDALGVSATIFRPPFGGRRPEVFRIARKLGLQPIMWNVTGYDWNAKSVDEIERKVTRQMRGGDVILLHDGGHLEMGTDRSHTVAVTDRIIRRYQQQGREFVTIPQMMDAEKI
ncbi:MAG: polysaccharide deacetylase family protein [Acidobacteria bacterium]|nr:MAG: polysaccharide deacetylase family protein [Acidobacteriota bacterium]